MVLDKVAIISTPSHSGVRSNALPIGTILSIPLILLLMIKEDKNYEQHKAIIESAVVSYLKETNQYDNMLMEEGDVMTFEPEQKPICNCFGIDIYEVDDKLVSEKQYAKTL